MQPIAISVGLALFSSLMFSGCAPSKQKPVDALNNSPPTKPTSEAVSEEDKPDLCTHPTPLMPYCNQKRIELNTYEIRDNLYWVSGVGLAFKSKGIGFDYAEVNYLDADPIWVFSTVFQPISGDNYIEPVIDVRTWRGGGIFYRDDKSFYCHHIMSDGGSLRYMSQFDPNELKFLLRDGREIPWADAEGYKRRDIQDFHGDYLTEGEHVIDFRCSVRTMAEHLERNPVRKD